MKKIICIFFGLLLVLGAKAQTLYNNQVRIEKQSVTRNEDTNLLSIDMDIVMQENLDLTSNHVAMLIPFLEANGRTKVLPPIVVYGRKREIVQARQIAMYLSRSMTKASLSSIGAQIGGKDHATVLYACKMVGNLITTDKRFKEVVEDLSKKITG